MRHDSLWSAVFRLHEFCFRKSSPQCAGTWMPGCQRLNASAQGLEDYSAIQEQPCDARCFSCAVQAPALPCGISSTNEQCPITQAPRFQPFTFIAALSGSSTKCSGVRGLWNAVPESHDAPSPSGDGDFLVDEVGALPAVCLSREEPLHSDNGQSVAG